MISMDKEYKTRDGREVRIYATDGKDDYPVHGAILISKDIGWKPHHWRLGGGYNYLGKDHEFDLIEVRPRLLLTQWVNIYNYGIDGGGYDTQEEARDADINGAAIARVRIHIDVTEGEGL